MDTTVTAPPVVVSVRVTVAGWLEAFGAAVLMYLSFSENGVRLTQSWEYLPEFFQDRRHVFGVTSH